MCLYIVCTSVCLSGALTVVQQLSYGSQRAPAYALAVHTHQAVAGQKTPSVRVRARGWLGQRCLHYLSDAATSEISTALMSGRSHRAAAAADTASAAAASATRCAFGLLLGQ